MKELLTANGKTYECTNVTTSLDSITFTMQGRAADELILDFETVSELTVAFENSEPHGVYKNLKLESVTTHAQDGSVSVTMHIKNDTEIRLDALEEGQEIQNAAIEELAAMQGGGN